jgi:hypothetical protein
MFIVVKVDQCYDYVEGVEYKEKFNTAEEAQNHINKLKEEDVNSYLRRKEYVENFVNDIKMPDFEAYPVNERYKACRDFLKDVYSSEWVSTFITTKNFRDALNSHLINHDTKYNNFNPPVITRNAENLFIIEVKCF